MKERYREARIIRAHEKRAERHPLWEIYGWRLRRVLAWFAAAAVVGALAAFGYRWVSGHVHAPALSLTHLPSLVWLWSVPAAVGVWMLWRVVKWFGGY